jgi:hypothetical protein
MQNVALVIQALASLLWPIFAFLALYLFRSEMIDVIKRVKKGKIFGQEFELDENLRILEDRVKVVADQMQARPEIEREINMSEVTPYNENMAENIIKQAANSPRVALIMLQEEIEKQARRTVAAMGLLHERSEITLQQALDELRQYGLPPALPEVLRFFSDVRNKFIHGQSAADDDIFKDIIPSPRDRDSAVLRDAARV